MSAILQWFLNLFIRAAKPDIDISYNLPSMPQDVSKTPIEPTPTPISNPDALLPWDMTGSLSHANWHNVRALCDLEGLSHELKEELCATVWAESEFNAHAVRHNYALHADGTRYVASTDNGICQWNDYYHGREISPTDAQNDPEKAVRLMCQYFFSGRQKQWVAFLNGSYKQHLGKTL